MSNPLHYCLNCAYLLTLLERRRKYKCAKCSKLYPRREIEDKSFKEWNKRQKQFDIENLKSEKKSRIKLSEEERKYRSKESAKRWRNNNRKKCRELSQKSYERNKDKILANRKRYRQQTKQQQNEWRRNYRNLNRDRVRLLTRINFWRQKQKMLTLQMIENQQYEVSPTEFLSSLPTYPLSYLLDKK